MLGYDENDKITVPPGYNVVATYKSKSDPTKLYHIVLAKDSYTLYCDCWQWKKNKTCSHLEHYINQVLPKLKEAQRKAAHDDDGELLVAIDKAISDLS